VATGRVTGYEADRMRSPAPASTAHVAGPETAARFGRAATLRWGLLFSLAVAAGIALRVWVHRSSLGIPDSDEAVVGLMVEHALRGELATFFWGQAYGGSQEALMTVPVFWLAGSSWLTLRLVPVALSAVAAVVVWRVGRRTIGEPAAAVAGCLSWIWPPFVIYKLTHQWGFYASGLLYSALLLLLTLRMTERPSKARLGAFGFVVGLSLWQSAQLVPIVVPLIVWAVWRQRSVLRNAWIAAGFAIVGALPSIVWNVRNDWGSFMSPIDDTTTYLHRLRVFASPLLPMLLGLRTPFTQERLLPAVLTLLLYAGIGVLLVYGAYRARHRDTSLLYVVALAFPFVYALAPATFFSQEPKYLVVLSPILVLLFAQLATTYWRAAAVIAVALVVSIATLDRMETYFRTVPSQPPVAPRDLAPLISTLDDLGLDRVYADFWLAYRLTFETDERIIASQNKFTQLSFANGQAIASRHPFIRYPPYERKVEAARHGFVLFRESIAHGADRQPGPEAAARVEQLARFVSQLSAHGYSRHVVGPFVVYAPPT
jgi:Dolichyl-phosphate-mannose-protein mannosyltransferase